MEPLDRWLRDGEVAPAGRGEGDSKVVRTREFLDAEEPLEMEMGGAGGNLSMTGWRGGGGASSSSEAGGSPPPKRGVMIAFGSRARMAAMLWTSSN